MSDPYNTEKLYPILEESKVSPTAPPPSPQGGHEYRLESCKKIKLVIEQDVRRYSSTLKSTLVVETFSHICVASLLEHPLF